MAQDVVRFESLFSAPAEKSAAPTTATSAPLPVRPGHEAPPRVDPGAPAVMKDSYQDLERKYLVVLGAAVHGSTPSLSMTHRLEGALDYLEAYPESTAIVSGGQGVGEDISEAQAMYDWLTAHGVAPERVIMENKSTSTMENLEFSYNIIRERGDEPAGNVAIVSSGYGAWGQRFRIGPAPEIVLVKVVKPSA